ncbi:MAG: HEAT repeat domain-containing protein [Methylovulum sp.]|uniref:HEAT repeat domain-containing protein n=1 Tax=Methylovulum sp. TaxID=1916980 RepID=UPI002627FEF6|nr:HEAT repeat domain-containing protein [Methylovulum sp.]MDD2724324.1 HEAT repeat domain-containing protein [Methylovulum sp.]MDD5124967.1 HEAT repeat domain-containing protein [Methylovulum sp.]
MQPVQEVKKFSINVPSLYCVLLVAGLLSIAQSTMAGDEPAKNTRQNSKLKTIQPSIQVDLPKNKGGPIRLRAKQATLSRILTTLSAKTGVKIHYPALPPNPITVTCAETNVKTVIECLLGQPVNMMTKMPEKLAKADQTAHLEPQPVELWILSVPTPMSHADSAKAGTIAEQPSKPAQQQSKHQAIAERDRDQFEETLKQTAAKNPEERATALYNLGLADNKDDPDVKDALRQALTDENAAVREQAAASITQSGDPELIAELNQQPQTDDNAGRTTDENTLSQDLALLQKATKGGEKIALDFIKDRLPDSEVEQ